MLQPNHQNPRRVRASFFLPDFIGNSSSADHQTKQISIFMEYSSSPSDALHRAILTLYIFWFLSNRQPLLRQNTFLDTVSTTILTLALFAHMCEMFVGVQSSVELFRHFFTIGHSPSLSPYLGALPQARTVGKVFFRRRGTNFLPLSLRDKWEN